MATVINTTPAQESNNPLGTVLAVMTVLIAVFLVLYYGLPALTSRTAVQPQPAAPADNANSLNIEVPDQIDVSVNE